MLYFGIDGCIAHHLNSSVTNVKTLLVQVLNMLGNVMEVISPRHCCVIISLTRFVLPLSSCSKTELLNVVGHGYDLYN